MHFKKLIVLIAMFCLLAGTNIFAQRGGTLTPQKPASFTLTINAQTPGSMIWVDNNQMKGTVFTLQPGNHQITVRSPGYLDFNTTINLQSDQTLNVTLMAANFNLTVNSNVAGAQVALSNGQGGQAGQTFSLPGGNYQITVTAPGFQTFSTSIQLGGNQTVTANLAPMMYNLTVNSNVQGSTIFINNNQMKGTSFQLPGGQHNVTVRAPGYVDFNTTIQLNGDQTISANLMPVTYNLTVNSNVQGAQVALSNGQNGQAGQSFNLPGGSYQITVNAPGYQTFSTSIQLNGNQTIIANLALQTGTLVVDAPKGTALQVFIDGSIVNFGKAGNSQGNANKNEKGRQILSDTQQSLDLTAGPHKVRVEVGFMVAETTITIVAGQTVTINPVLTILVK